MSQPSDTTLPVGAESSRDGIDALPRLGARLGPGRGCRRRAWRRGRSRDAARRGGGRLFLRRGGRCRAPATAIASGSATSWLPTRRRGFSRTVRSGPSRDRRSGALTPGATRAGAACRCKARSSTRCTSARSPPEGTWAAATEQLAELARDRHHRARGDAGGRVSRPLRLGLRRRLPVRADAVSTARPDDFRAFVDRAHALGLGVILDVVYNHLGPDGLRLQQATPKAYFTDKLRERVGRGAQLRRRRCRRRCASSSPSNAAYWIDEFHLDGLRLDATQSIHDASAEHILALIARARARRGGRPRPSLIVPRTSRSTSAWCGRRPRAATASTRCGTTTSITAPSSR